MRKMIPAVIAVIVCITMSQADVGQSINNMNSWINKIRTTPNFFNPPLPNQPSMFSTEQLTHFQINAFQRYTLYRFLNANRQYIFVASGDNSTKNIDMYIFDPGGAQISYDNLNDADAACAYRPYNDGNFRIEVELREAMANTYGPYWLCFQLFQVP